MLELLPAFHVGNKSSCASSQLELFKPSQCKTKSASVFFWGEFERSGAWESLVWHLRS
jgi:hypothetical protein